MTMFPALICITPAWYLGLEKRRDILKRDFYVVVSKKLGMSRLRFIANGNGHARPVVACLLQVVYVDNDVFESGALANTERDI